METKRISELATQVTEALITLGISRPAAWEQHCRVFEPIIALHKLQEKDFADMDIINGYARDAADKVDNGEIGWSHYRRIQRGVERLLEFCRHGKIEWTFPSRPSKFKLNPYYEKIVCDFISTSDFHPNTQGDIVWVARKYFAWLMNCGKGELNDVGAQEIQGFLIHCSNHLKLGSIRNTQLYLKKLYAYLADCGLSSSNFEELLSYKVVRGTRIYPAASATDIAQILEQVDRRIPKGKRDYAIILLGAVIGIRAIDIIRMKLSDIDWERGEIKIVQAKTGTSLALPLTTDVGNALEDYILRGRPDTPVKEIFIRDHKPFRGFKDSVSIGDMFDVYRKKAGLPRDPFDGNGFHSLRRGLGKSLVVAQTPLEDAAQIFGTLHVDNMKKYIALDNVHLKECALSFDGIEPTSISARTGVRNYE
jgi:integrase